VSEIIRYVGSRLRATRRLMLAPGSPALGALVALAFAVATAVVHADEDELHDPFMPPGWNEPDAPAGDTFSASAWTLASTLTSNGRRVAIINGRAVRPGDHIGGARLLGVTRGSARLEYNGHRFTIRRPGTRVRTSPEPAQ